MSLVCQIIHCKKVDINIICLLFWNAAKNDEVVWCFPNQNSHLHPCRFFSSQLLKLIHSGFEVLNLNSFILFGVEHLLFRYADTTAVKSTEQKRNRLWGVKEMKRDRERRSRKRYIFCRAQDCTKLHLK